jgi:hypothetical protein
MPDVRALTFGEIVEYKGLINVEDLYKLIDKWFRDHGYDKNEIWSYEEIYEDGKQITLKIQPYKKISDYIRIEIRITATLKKLNEVILEKKGLKIKTMKGEARFVFDTFIITDYGGHWETRPLYFFMKTVAEKFLYKSYIDNYNDLLLKDKDDIKREIRKFLNMQRLGD